MKVEEGMTNGLQHLSEPVSSSEVRGAVGLYFAYETGQVVEREIVGAIRGWKEAGFPALVNIKTEKVGDKFSLY